MEQHRNGSMFDRCGDCPYYEFADEPFSCRDELISDALAMLKEQDMPILTIADAVNSLLDKHYTRLKVQNDDEYICKKCMKGLKTTWKWCPWCGQKTELLTVWIKDPVRFVEGD